MAVPTKRRAWTRGDVATLKSMARKKIPTAKISKVLKRSQGATRQKAFSLKIPMKAA
jgi:hypothetical protein